MDEKKKATASSAGSSRRAGVKDRMDLKALNTQLLNKATERRKEIDHLQQQLAQATERLQSATAEINTLEMRLLAEVREKGIVEIKKERILEQLWDLSLEPLVRAQRENKWRRWMYAAAATATVCAGAAIVGFYLKRRQD